MSLLAFPDSFEYLCYGSTAIIIIFTLTERQNLTKAGNDFSRQILTTKVHPRTVRVIEAPPPAVIYNLIIGGVLTSWWSLYVISVVCQIGDLSIITF